MIINPRSLVFVTIFGLIGLTSATTSIAKDDLAESTTTQTDQYYNYYFRTVFKKLARLKKVKYQLRYKVRNTNRTIRRLKERNSQATQLGPRPFFLVNDMDESSLKETLKQCENGPFYKSDFSIGHRGAALQFPEHTVSGSIRVCSD